MFRIPPVSQWGRAVRKTSHSCHLMSQHALQWDALQQAEWTDGHHAPASALATMRLRFFLCRLHFLLMCSGLFWEGTFFYKATKDTMISDLLTYHPISHLQHMHTQPCKHHVGEKRRRKEKALLSYTVAWWDVLATGRRLGTACVAMGYECSSGRVLAETGRGLSTHITSSRAVRESFPPSDTISQV